MFGSRVLSLLALVIALVALDGAIGHAPGTADRAELAQPGGDFGGPGSDDGCDGVDLTLPPLVIAPQTLPNPAGSSLLVAERAPATSAFSDNIFRPPISALA